jgi:hypothetical protein
MKRTICEVVDVARAGTSVWLSGRKGRERERHEREREGESPASEERRSTSRRWG